MHRHKGLMIGPSIIESKDVIIRIHGRDGLAQGQIKKKPPNPKTECAPLEIRDVNDDLSTMIFEV